MLFLDGENNVELKSNSFTFGFPSDSLLSLPFSVSLSLSPLYLSLPGSITVFRVSCDRFFRRDVSFTVIHRNLSELWPVRFLRLLQPYQSELLYENQGCG